MKETKAAQQEGDTGKQQFRVYRHRLRVLRGTSTLGVLLILLLGLEMHCTKEAISPVKQI